MALLDLTERNIKIEHIEGYLYGMQEIDNYIVSSQGSTNEYTVNRLDNNSDFSDIELIADYFLNKTSYSSEVTEQIKIKFKTHLISVPIEDWKTELRNNIPKWFIDKHLSEKYIREASLIYLNQFDNWTDEQKSKFIHNFEEAERRTKQRLLNSKQSVEILLNMIEVFMNFNFKLNKIDLTQLKENERHLPLVYDIYHLKNKHENIILHFDKSLT